MSTKSFTIWNTIGNNRNDFESDASTLEELQREFSQRGISHNNMSIVLGETQATLESKQALLPDTSHVIIFLFQKKVKSGSIDKAALLKTFSRSNSEAKLRIAKKNGYKDIESFRSFLKGGGSKATAKSPVKPSVPTKTAPKAVPKAQLPVAVKKAAPRVAEKPSMTKEVIAPTSAKMSDEDLRRKADAIKRALPY